MKKRFLFPLFAALFSLTACDFTIFSIEDKETEKDDQTIVDPVVVDEYYKDYDLKKTGGRLIVELQKMCFAKHTKWITYGNLNSYFGKTSSHNSAEAIEDGSSKNQWFYTGKEAAGVGTREHVWPCANSDTLWTHDNPGSGTFSPHYVDSSYYVGGGSDLYHVRTCNSDVNTARGNSKFVDFDHPEHVGNKTNLREITENNGKWSLLCYGGSNNPSSGKYEYATRSEPDDNMKGDIARIVLYVYVHYAERGITPDGGVKSGNNTYKYSDMTGSLALTQIMGYDDEERCKEVLIEWNNLDKPSEVEKLRNTTVQKIQGNRNPFIDHPELVDQMFE